MPLHLSLPLPQSRSLRNLKVLLGAWLRDVFEEIAVLSGGQSRGGKGCARVCMSSCTPTRVCASGEHSPDSHVKKPQENRARASHENTLWKSLVSLSPGVKLSEMKITALAGHLGAASSLLLQLKLLFRSVSCSYLHSPLRLGCSFPSLSGSGIEILGSNPAFPSNQAFPKH